MALSAVLDSLDGLNEAIKAEYRNGDPEKNKSEDADKFYLDVTPVAGFALEDVSGLKTVLGEVKAERSTLKERLAAIGDLDLAEAKAALKQVKEWKTNPPKDKEAIEAAIADRVKQLEDKHQNELKSKEDLIGKRTNQISRLLVDDVLDKELDKHSLVKGGKPFARDAMRGHLNVVEKDGELVAEVIDPKTKSPRISLKSGSTDNMGVSELVETLLGTDDFAPLVAGSGASGTGAAGGTGGKKGGGNAGTVDFRIGGGGDQNPNQPVQKALSAAEMMKQAREAHDSQQQPA